MIFHIGLATALVMATASPSPPTTSAPPVPDPPANVTAVAGAAPASAPPVPDPPINVTAVAGVASIRVSWQNPPMELGVANYVAYAEPGGATCDTLDWRTFGCELRVQPGRSYRVSVRSNGTSAPAYAPGRVTPLAVPKQGVDRGLPATGGRVLGLLAIGTLLLVLGAAASLAGRGRLSRRR